MLKPLVLFFAVVSHYFEFMVMWFGCMSRLRFDSIVADVAVVLGERGVCCSWSPENSYSTHQVSDKKMCIRQLPPPPFNASCEEHSSAVLAAFWQGTC